ncbi:MAG TPA: MFS transporter [Sphingomonas sp.]|nr:MFS transporter [Sphingomonas sp.]
MAVSRSLSEPPARASAIAIGRPQSRGYILALLTLVYTVNFVDRQVLPILLPAIKAEFHVSDTALGLLVGPTFAFFYAILGVPLAMLADRVSRRRLIGISLFLFSIVTLLCGVAAQFWHLVLARIGTGIGEAGTGPASQTIIADLYPPAERARAQAIYAAGVNAGVLIAFAMGGVVAERFGWRAAFVVAGIPGLLLAILLLLTLEEPERGRADPAPATPTPPAPPLTTVLKTLWADKAFRLAVIGGCTTCFTGYAVGGFFPTLLVRTHHMRLGEIGLAIALIAGVGGGLATYAAGHAADRLARRDVRWYFRVPAIAALLPLPLAPLCFLSDNAAVALAASVPILSLTAAFIGPVVAIIQRLVPLRMRATAIAVLILVDSLVGLGLGPQFVGLVSDWLTPALGANALGVAMLASMIGSALSAIAFLIGSRHLAAALDAAGSAE